MWCGLCLAQVLTNAVAHRVEMSLRCRGEAPAVMRHVRCLERSEVVDKVCTGEGVRVGRRDEGDTQPQELNLVSGELAGAKIDDIE